MHVRSACRGDKISEIRSSDGQDEAAHRVGEKKVPMVLSARINNSSKHGFSRFALPVSRRVPTLPIWRAILIQ